MTPSPQPPFELTQEDYWQHAADSRKRRLTIKPNTPMNRYSIEAMTIFEEAMTRLALGFGSFEDETQDMIRLQSAAAIKHGVEP